MSEPESTKEVKLIITLVTGREYSFKATVSPREEPKEWTTFIANVLTSRDDFISLSMKGTLLILRRSSVDSVCVLEEAEGDKAND